MVQASSLGGLIALYIVIPLGLVGAVLWARGALKDLRNNHNRHSLEKTFQQFEEAYEKALRSAPLQLRDSLNIEAAEIEKSHPETAVLLRSLGSAIANTNTAATLAQWRAALRAFREQIPAFRPFGPRLGSAMFTLAAGGIIGVLASNAAPFQVLWGLLTQLAQWLSHVL
jgi:hypothetical protein